ncbi:hypothetical protein ACJMK2_033707 [Sinanodonta woodiana]|uniref:Uncharacterized protein n=1 Tax=Sinanodonta woodiana TaxID=1069815 RepID=A0ABD3WQJ9_SINWO
MKWSSWMSVWLASGLLSLQTGIVYSNTCTSSSPLKLENGKSLQGFRIWALQVRDILQCARACVQQTICRSFNFDNKTNFCELNSKIKEEKPEFVVDNAAMVYSDISKWEPEIFPECFNKPCPENAVCLPKALAEPGCEFACLDILVSCSEGKTYGQNKSYPCPKGQKGSGFSICQADSTWSEINFSGCEVIFNSLCIDQAVCDPINGTCSQNKCLCRNGGVYDADQATCNYGVFGQLCSSPDHCKSINGSCSSSQRCVCSPGMTYSEEYRLCLSECGQPSNFELTISSGGLLAYSTRQVQCAERLQAAGVDNDTIVCQQNGSWSQPQQIDCRGFRFANTTGAVTEGQLEMFFKHEWRHVSMDYWNSVWTRTACESMNFRYGGSWYGPSVFGATPIGWKLWRMTDKCENPINCSKSEISDGFLNAVGITCFTEILNRSNVRLVNNTSNNAKEGYVELLYRGEWGAVCQGFWGDNEVDVLCKMMSMQRDGIAVWSSYYIANVTASFWTYGMQCTKNETSIFECRNMGWNKTLLCLGRATARCKV